MRRAALSICGLLLACGGRDATEPSEVALSDVGLLTVVGHGNLPAGQWTSDLWVHGTVAYTGTIDIGTGIPGNTMWAWDVSNPATPVRSASVVVDARTVNDVKIRADGTLGLITHEGSNQVVASFYGGSSFLHDVYLRNGLAFLSHWDAGLIILDVSNGVAGGSPTNPVLVGRVQTVGGQTHNAWYWPAAGYVFVGEESSRPGVVHVVDVSDLSNPEEVATFGVSGDTPHNFWLDEARGILYVAWYSRGLRAIDVGGELLGPLETQGREVGSIEYSGATFSWAPQLHGGLVYVSDIISGLWILRPEF